jgi:hypothetical protein
MGYNTVAVLYNDHNFKDDSTIGPRIQNAMRNWSWRDRDPLATHFGVSVVVSQAHADYPQVVVVGQNSGRPISEANGLDRMALDQMVACLVRHGYKITAPKKKL